jgi:Cthe_2314-like HEPN
MVITINPFEDIFEVDFDKDEKESPLLTYEYPRGLFQQENNFSRLLFNSEMNHWETTLMNRIFATRSMFTYAMFYYYKGIPDDEWFLSPGLQGQSVQYFPHFTNEHFSNQYNFIFFADSFFLKAFTVFETIGQMLFRYYNLEYNEDDFRDQISYNNAVYKLFNVDRPISRKLSKLKKSDDFQNGLKIRNAITHSHPPYEISSGVTIKTNGGSFGIGEYTTSKELKKVMIGLLRSIKATLEVLEKHLAKTK